MAVGKWDSIMGTDRNALWEASASIMGNDGHVLWTKPHNALWDGWRAALENMFSTIAAAKLKANIISSLKKMGNLFLYT